MTVTANDLYALGLAVGNLLRDVDPARRDPVLDLIRTLERKAEGVARDAPCPVCGQRHIWRKPGDGHVGAGI